MLVPVNWMKEYVELNDSIKDFSDRITLTGSHVDSINSVAQEIDNVVVGKITSLEKHPEAKRLSIVAVDAGAETVTLVTGAKNMAVGDYVALAKEGATLPGGVTIGVAEFMGMKSPGMLCSLEELGFDDKVIPRHLREGLLIMEGDLELGADIKEVLGLNAEVIDFEITPNRPDCLSIVGMAREAAATYNTHITLPEVGARKGVGSIATYLKGIDIETPKCSRYIGRVIEDVVIEPSPQWMQNALMASGMRPINNLVDITNYVMLELGQPLHAFDLDMLADQRIIVREAAPGEVLKTLDGTDRNLEPGMMVIADGEKPVALAGVMGGFDSEVTEKTHRILLESAVFDRESVRTTSKKLGLRSEASSRYEKGLSVEIAELASQRVCYLIEQLGCGVVVNGHINAGLTEAPTRMINLRPHRVCDILGIALTVDEMTTYLTSLEFEVEKSNDLLVVTIPHFRLDVEGEADLAEEIGRLFGFHNIPPQPLKGQLTRGEKSPMKEYEEVFKDGLCAVGLDEISTYSFISPKVFQKLQIPEDSPMRRVVEIMNPLGEDFSIMRPTMIGNMLNVLEKNNNQKLSDLSFYEIGNIFVPGQKDELPEERDTLCIGLCGKEDFYTLKDRIVKVFKTVGLEGLDFVRETDNPTFHPGRSASLWAGGERLGVLGELSYGVMENSDIRNRVYIAEIDLVACIAQSNPEKLYAPIPRYPRVTRDIALVVDRQLETKTLENFILSAGGDLVKTVALFDEYTGDQIDDRKKSLAYKIVFGAEDRTLVDEEVNTSLKRILEGLNAEYDATIRL